MSASNLVQTPTSTTPAARLDQGIVLLLAVACGVTVANTYYVQPLLDTIARGLNTGTTQAGLLVTFGQLGYAVGLALLVPLGDRVDRRRLVTVVLSAAALALVVAAAAPSIAVLAVAIALVGVTSVIAQVLVPFAAALSTPEGRGRVIGTVMTGLMLGTLLSRTAAGLVSEIAGWRSVFGLSAILMVGLAGLLHWKLPYRPPTVTGSYRALLVSVARLMVANPILRRRSLYGALAFGLMNLFWAPIAFLLAQPPFRLGDAAVGLLGLAGVPAALVASHIGRLADTGRGRSLTGAYFTVLLGGLILALLGRDHLPALAIAAFLVTFGTQSVHVTNQAEIYRIDGAAHARVNTGYMTSYFFGGVAGSAAAAAAYAWYGWTAVTGIGIGIGILGLILWLTEILVIPARRGRSAVSLPRDEPVG
jgi:predicted MFS family arabinose efflux permease